MGALTNLREWNLFPKWVDSISLIRSTTDGLLHAVGGAVDALGGSNKHYVFDNAGNVLYNITGPFTPTNEAGLSNVLTGKLALIGGTTSNEIWYFDPSISGYTAGSWQNITFNMDGDIGTRTMAAMIDGGNGWFYVFGGFDQSTIQKTQDFVSWTLVGNLPAPIDKLSACAYCFFNSKIWLIGGMADVVGVDLYNGTLNPFVYTFDPATDAFVQVHSDIIRFGNIWCDAAATDTHIYLSKGFIPPEQIPVSGNPTAQRGNQRGFMRSTDGITWEDITLEDGVKTYFERHRNGIVKLYSTEVLMIAGYNANGVWKYAE
jgi:hypothetical protein